MFFSHEQNTGIAQRMEVGGSSFVPQVTTTKGVSCDGNCASA